MGGGSTIAAALAVDYESIGIESDPAFFKIAERAIPRLADLPAAAMSETRERHRAPMTEIDCNDSLRSEEHTSELQSLAYLVCRLLLEKKKTNKPLQRRRPRKTT